MFNKLKKGIMLAVLALTLVGGGITATTMEQAKPAPEGGKSGTTIDQAQNGEINLVTARKAGGKEEPFLLVTARKAGGRPIEY